MASEFSLMVDETMNIVDQAKFAIFVCYDSNKHSVTEEFLGLTDIVMYWSAEALCEKIREVLIEKGVDISLMTFNSFTRTNTMSGEILGLQRRFCHTCPHSKYIYHGNHQLRLVFVHLIPKHKYLKEVDASIMAVWKLMKFQVWRQLFLVQHNLQKAKKSWSYYWKLPLLNGYITEKNQRVLYLEWNHSLML